MARSGITRRLHAALVIAVVVAAAWPAHSRAVTWPSAPLNLTAAAGDDLVLLRWNTPVDDGGSPITSYLINAYVGGVLLYQGEVFPASNELILGNNQFAINTLEAVFLSKVPLSARRPRIERAISCGPRCDATRTLRRDPAVPRRRHVLLGQLGHGLVLAVVRTGDGSAMVRKVKPTTGSFTVYLNKSVSQSTTVSWIAFG